MGRAPTLRVADVRAVFYLLGELRDLSPQPQLWKQHMLCGLCRLTEGQVGISVQMVHGGAVDPATLPIIDIGCAGEEERRTQCGYDRLNDLHVTSSREVVQRLVTFGRRFLQTRERLDSYRHPLVGGQVQVTREESAFGNCIFSYRPMPHSHRYHWLYILRPRTDGPFTTRQQRLLHLFHDELNRILELDAARTERFDPLGRLSPRLRETLNLLAEGLSEKQVARNLCCSNHTIHGYVKELHKRLNVTNRAELLLAVDRQRRLAQRVLQL